MLTAFHSCATASKTKTPRPHARIAPAAPSAGRARRHRCRPKGRYGSATDPTMRPNAWRATLATRAPRAHCTDAMLTRIDQRCYRSRRVHTVRGRLLCIVNRCHSLPTVFKWVVLSNWLDDAQALSCGQIQQRPEPHVRRPVSRGRPRLLGAHWLLASGAMSWDWIHLPRGKGGQDERGARFEADHRQHWWAD